MERIRERMFPLIKICKEYGTVIRIGTNHGSLSDRILSRLAIRLWAWLNRHWNIFVFAKILIFIILFCQ